MCKEIKLIAFYLLLLTFIYIMNKNVLLCLVHCYNCTVGTCNIFVCSVFVTLLGLEYERKREIEREVGGGGGLSEK